MMSALSSISLTEFAAATLHLSASSCADSNLNSKDESMTTILSSVLPPLGDVVDRLLKHRQLFILHRFRKRADGKRIPADDWLHFFDAHTLKPVSAPKPGRLLESLTGITDSCYLPHGLGCNKPALVIAATSVSSASIRWAPTICILDEDFNCVNPPPWLTAESPRNVSSICPHPSEPSVVLCASASTHCVLCLNIATGEWYRFGGSSLSDFSTMDAIVALPSCGLLAVGSYNNDRIAVCEMNNPATDYEDVNCDRFEDCLLDLCSTSFAALGDRYFVCMMNWGIGVYDALRREQIDFFPLQHQDQEACKSGGLVKALQVPVHQQPTTLGLFLVFHRDVLQIVRCDHQLQWSVVNDVDGGPLLEALTKDGYDVEFVGIV